MKLSFHCLQQFLCFNHEQTCEQESITKTLTEEKRKIIQNLEWYGQGRRHSRSLGGGGGHVPHYQIVRGGVNNLNHSISDCGGGDRGVQVKMWTEYNVQQSSTD